MNDPDPLFPNELHLFWEREGNGWGKESKTVSDRWIDGWFFSLTFGDRILWVCLLIRLWVDFVLHRTQNIGLLGFSGFNQRNVLLWRLKKKRKKDHYNTKKRPASGLPPASCFFILKPSSILILSSILQLWIHEVPVCLDHMISAHKWPLETKFYRYEYVRVHMCARFYLLFAVFVVPKGMLCGWDFIVRAAEAVAMALASEGRCFMTDGGKKTLYRVTHPKNIPVSRQKPHSVTVSVHTCMYMCLWMHRKALFHNNEPPFPRISFGPQSRQDSPWSKKSTKDTVTPVDKWEWTNRVKGEVKRSGERMGQKKRLLKKKNKVAHSPAPYPITDHKS